MRSTLAKTPRVACITAIANPKVSRLRLEHEDNGMMLNFVVEAPLFQDGFEALA